MVEYRNGEYFLTEKESRFLFEQSIHPDAGTMERRNSFFAEIDDTLQINYLEDGSMTIEIPDIEAGKIVDSFRLDKCTFSYSWQTFGSDCMVGVQDSCLSEAA